MVFQKGPTRRSPASAEYDLNWVVLVALSVCRLHMYLGLK